MSVSEPGDVAARPIHVTETLTADVALGAVAADWDADQAVTDLYSAHYRSLVRLSALLVSQAFWVGLFGISLAQPAAQGLAWCFRRRGPQVQLPPWLLAGAAAVTLLMALLSGLLALRSLRLAEPSNLLR